MKCERERKAEDDVESCSTARDMRERGLKMEDAHEREKCRKLLWSLTNPCNKGEKRP